jgi:hypothetical protein
VGCHLGWHLAAADLCEGATEEKIMKNEPLVCQNISKEKRKKKAWSKQVNRRKPNHMWRIRGSSTAFTFTLWRFFTNLQGTREFVLSFLLWHSVYSIFNFF